MDGKDHRLNCHLSETDHNGPPGIQNARSCLVKYRLFYP